MGIVLDKSYLRGTKKDRITQISRENILVMSASLLYEVFKSDTKERVKLLNKFPDTHEPFYLAPRLGDMFLYELKNKRAYPKPTSINQTIDYSNSAFRDKKHQLNKEQICALEKERDRVEFDTNLFLCTFEKSEDKLRKILKTGSDEENQKNRDSFEKK